MGKYDSQTYDYGYPQTHDCSAGWQKHVGGCSTHTQCDKKDGEVMLKRSSRKVSTIDQCKESCENAAGCLSITFFQNGWCAHYSTPCTKTKRNRQTVVVQLLAKASNSNLNDAMFEQNVEQHATDLSPSQGAGGAWWILMIVYLFNVFTF